MLGLASPLVFATISAEKSVPWAGAQTLDTWNAKTDRHSFSNILSLLRLCLLSLRFSSSLRKCGLQANYSTALETTLADPCAGGSGQAGTGQRLLRPRWSECKSLEQRRSM